MGSSVHRLRWTAVMGQTHFGGEHGQVHALFGRDRLVAAYQRPYRRQRPRPQAMPERRYPAVRDYAPRVGAHLRWHDGLTLD